MVLRDLGKQKYIFLSESVIDSGKKVIILVPEISLTPQTIKRFQERFDKVAVYHSKLSFSENLTSGGL